MWVANRIVIRAPVERVYRLGAEVERWPALLPHYRWVRVLEARAAERVVEMACWRDRIPLRWTAVQRLEPEGPRILFRHVRGVTTGMEVAWRFRPVADGVEVRIEHELALRWPLIGPAAADRIIGPFFISNVAGKTLRRIKQLAEAGG